MKTYTLTLTIEADDDIAEPIANAIRDEEILVHNGSKMALIKGLRVTVGPLVQIHATNPPKE